MSQSNAAIKRRPRSHARCIEGLDVGHDDPHSSLDRKTRLSPNVRAQNQLLVVRQLAHRFLSEELSDRALLAPKFTPNKNCALSDDLFANLYSGKNAYVIINFRTDSDDALLIDMVIASHEDPCVLAIGENC